MSFELDVAQLKSKIQAQSFVELTWSLTPEAVEQAIKGFFEFLSLPVEIKNQFVYEIKRAEGDRGMDVGYRERKSETGAGYDDKEFFHYNQYAKQELGSLAESLPEAKRFFGSAEVIYQAALSKMQELVRVLDTGYQGAYEQFFPQDQIPECVVRFLKYDRTQLGDYLARGHYDRGALTLAIAESAPGLRIGKDPEHVQEVVHTPGTVLFFPGMSAAQYTHNDFQPSWHEVVQNSADTLSADVARWALVFFATPPGPIYFSREVLHAPLKKNNL